MSPENIWFGGDHHLGHENIIRFKRNDGSPLRDFKTIDEHNAIIIYNHNKVVKPTDHFYFVGDLSMNNAGLKLVPQFNGVKKLVKGNHDQNKLAEYRSVGITNIHGVRVFTPKDTGVDNLFFVVSHVPLHPNSLDRWQTNIHAHTHANIVRLPDGTHDDRYECVSLEQLDNYTPVSLAQLVEKYKHKATQKVSDGYPAM